MPMKHLGPMGTLLVPTESDWGDLSGDPDAGWAYRIFFGKSREEVFELAEQDVVGVMENIDKMPSRAFWFYFWVFVEFVASLDPKTFDGAADAASCLMNYTRKNLIQSPEKILPLLDLVMPVIDDISARQAEFDAPINIYGDFSEIARDIRRLGAVG